MPKISVLMGVYNCADTVVKSIDSIVAQTFTDWEFIICDDGSTDNTFSVVERYAQKEKRIKLICNEKNAGLSFTLNHCLKFATGEYCARMDGDDVCDPMRFIKQVKFLDEHPEYGFVSTTMKRCDEIGIYQCPPIGGVYVPTKKDFVKGSPFSHAPVMIRRSVYETVSGYRDLKYTAGVEDYDLWFRIYAANIQGAIIEEPLYTMFDGRDATKRRTFKRRLNELYVRKEGYRAIKVPFFYRIYAFKPILVGLIPHWIYRLIHRGKGKRKSK